MTTDAQVEAALRKWREGYDPDGSDPHERMRAALAAAQAAGAEWQPIETIPNTPLDDKNYGPPVLLFIDGQCWTGCWDEDFKKPYVWADDVRGSPTHWLPTPQPPAALSPPASAEATAGKPAAAAESE